MQNPIDLNIVATQTVLRINKKLANLVPAEETETIISDLFKNIFIQAFKSVPPSKRNRLYGKISLFTHPDKLIRKQEYYPSTPQNHFVTQYFKWLDKNSNNENLLGLPHRILQDIKAQYPDDLGYTMHYKPSTYSWQETAQLNTYIRWTRYNAWVNICLDIVKLLCDMIALIGAIALLSVTFIGSLWIFVQILPAAIDFESIVMAQMMYSMDLRQSIYLCLFNATSYIDTLQDHISHQELADYIRSKHAQEVDLSTETEDKVLAYARAQKEGPDYDLDSILLVKEYADTFYGFRSIHILLSAMYRTLSRPLPTEQISLTVHRPTHNPHSQLAIYTRKASRKHTIHIDSGTEYIGHQPWTSPNIASQPSHRVHFINHRLYVKDNSLNTLRKLNCQAPELEALPNYVVRTADSVFIYTERKLLRLQVAHPTLSPKQQYIRMGTKLFFYDGKNDACKDIQFNPADFDLRFAGVHTIDALSPQDKDFIKNMSSTAHRSTHTWNIFMAITIKLLRALSFIPFLALESVHCLLKPIVLAGFEAIPSMQASVRLCSSSFFKLPLDIYDSCVSWAAQPNNP